jgi:uncharacterized membrane protein AbrB (regulator of aidB expression)
MRKRTKYAISAVVGALVFAALAEMNDLPLALLVGAGVGMTIALVVHAYPNDIAPPADRRHENTQRRKAAAKG